jgi:hypothetical protein
MRELNLAPRHFQQLMQDVNASNFCEIVEIGHMLCRAFWEGIGRKALFQKGFNTGLYNMQMQNRFGWAQKSEESKTNYNVEGLAEEVIDDQIRQKLSALMKDVA